MDDIRPTKIIVNVDALKSDNAENRAGYDARIISPADLPPEVSHYKLYNFFGFTMDDRLSEQKNKKLKDIFEWSHRRTRNTNGEDVMKELKHLELKLGLPILGESRLDQLWNFCHLDLQIQDLEKQRDGFLRWVY